MVRFSDYPFKSSGDIFANINILQSFSWQTFKRVGPSLVISRTYKIVLILSIVIQLSSFFILTSIALWLDQLWNGAIGHLAIWPLYRVFLTITLVVSFVGIFVPRRLTSSPPVVASPVACLCEQAQR